MAKRAFLRISPFPLTSADFPAQMTPGEFRAAFPSEGQYVEWKAGTGRRPIQEAIVAFSNADGGVVMIGVDDRGAAVGCPLDEGVEKDLWETIGQIESPGPVQVRGMRVGRAEITVVAVGPRRDGVAQTSNGRPLIRQGKQNLPLLGRELRQLMANRLPGDFEMAPSRWILDDVDRELLIQLCHALGIESNQDPVDLAAALAQRGLAVPSDSACTLTNAGALFLVTEMSVAFGKSHIEVLRFREGNPEYDRREVFDGTPSQQVQTAVDWIIGEIGFDLVVLRTVRHELARLPVDALREALANAVAHRDYQLTGSAVEVHLRPKEVTVISPGGFAGGVTSENIGEAHFSRNKAVINALRAFGLAEDAGRGIDLIRREMAAALRFEPTFEEVPTSWVRAVLPTDGPVTPEELAWTHEILRDAELLPGDRRVLVEALRGAELTNSTVRSLLHVGVSPARNTLQRLCESGYLEDEGGGGATRYRLSAAIPAPYGRPLSRDEMRAVILDWANKGPVTNSLVQSRFGVSRSQALTLLRGLARDGLLAKHGAGRGASYQLTD